MLKLGSCLLFITFAELIGTILFTQLFTRNTRGAFGNIHPVIHFILLIELCFSVFLIFKGYSKIDNED